MGGFIVGLGCLGLILLFFGAFALLGSIIGLGFGIAGGVLRAVFSVIGTVLRAIFR